MSTTTIPGTKIPVYSYNGVDNTEFVNILRNLLPVVKAGTWVSDDVEDQVELRNLIEYLRNGVEKLRKSFDEVCWAGHDDGSVDSRVESIRARSEFTNGRPGRKAKTTDEILAEL